MGQGKEKQNHLSPKPVERAPLALERVNDIERGDRLALGVFGVRDGVADDGFEEGFEDAAGFFVDHWVWGVNYHGSLRAKMERFLIGREVETRERGGRGLFTGRDTLDASTASETADGGLGDALDVVAEDLAVTFGAAFAKAFASFSACEGL